MINRISGDQLLGPLIQHADIMMRYSIRMHGGPCPIATFDATRDEFERFSEAWQKLNDEQKELDRKKEALRAKLARGGFKGDDWFRIGRSAVYECG